MSAANASPSRKRIVRGSPLHTTPGIPVHMHPVIALVTAGSRWTCSVLPTTTILGARTRNEDVLTPELHR